MLLRTQMNTTPTHHEIRDAVESVLTETGDPEKKVVNKFVKTFSARIACLLVVVFASLRARANAIFGPKRKTKNVRYKCNSSARRVVVTRAATVEMD
jgi:hypothetical protein